MQADGSRRYADAEHFCDFLGREALERQRDDEPLAERELRDGPLEPAARLVALGGLFRRRRGIRQSLVELYRAWPARFLRDVRDRTVVGDPDDERRSCASPRNRGNASQSAK